MSDIITDKEKFIKGWEGGLPETPCGSGSTLSFTKPQRDWIPKIVEKYNIKSIIDVGAGDLNWWPLMKLPEDVRVEHVDLVPRHKDVWQLDLVNEVPPKFDLIVVLWVINHLPYEHALSALRNIKASGCRYLMTTDRPIWHKEQPPVVREMSTNALEQLIVRPEKDDKIILVDLDTITV